MRWYTAIGVKRDGTDGRFYVRCASEEKILTGMEIQIWSTLLWSFCEEKAIFGRMMGLLHLAFGTDGAGQRTDEGEFWYCLRRLETRGLAASCEAETLEDAARELVRRGTMVRARRSRQEKVQLFLNSLGMGRGLKFSLRAFREAEVSQEEENLLIRLEREGRIDCHLRQLEVQAGHVASLVEGEDPGFAKNMQQEFLTGVIALYNKKHLLIESIRKEEFFEGSKETAGYAADAGLHP